MKNLTLPNFKFLNKFRLKFIPGKNTSNLIRKLAKEQNLQGDNKIHNLRIDKLIRKNDLKKYFSFEAHMKLQ